MHHRDTRDPAVACPHDRPVIDRRTLAETIGAVPGERRAALLGRFRSDLETRLAAIEAALACDDIPALDRASHDLFGVAGSFGAACLAASAGALHDRARRGDRLSALAGAGRVLACGRDTLADFDRASAELVPEPVPTRP